MATTFILASQSPRRRHLLSLLGLPVLVQISGANEDIIDGQDPLTYVNSVARRKAEVIAAQPRPVGLDRPIIVAADTTVVIDDQILGKPATASEAKDMLRLLRNRSHLVHTGMCVIDLATGQEVVEASTSIVTMRDYANDEMESYVNSGDPLDKAGAYAIQDSVFRPVLQLEGCYPSVMGLSLCHLADVLGRLGIPISIPLSALEGAHDGYPCPLLSTIADKNS